MSVLAVLQAASSPGGEAADVHLHAHGLRSRAQLTGLKLRALVSVKADGKDHLYVVQWQVLPRQLSQPQGFSSVCVLQPKPFAPHHTALAMGPTPRAAPSAVTRLLVVELGEAPPTRNERQEVVLLEAVLSLLQQQASWPRVSLWLVQPGPLVSQVAGAGVLGLARSARAEAQLPIRCIGATTTFALAHVVPDAEAEAVAVSAGQYSVPRLVHMRQPPQPAPPAMAAAAYHLLTGGTGGLGLLTARWLAQRGACGVVLGSRSCRVTDASTWRALCTSGVATAVVRCDTSQAVDVGWLLSACLSTLPEGLWHASGVLTDSILTNQTERALAFAYAPKAHSACLLQATCSTLPLRTWALFSSVAGLLGGAGQGSYSAANASLDSLAIMRRQRAQMATSIQWGAWADVGMASRGVASERLAVTEARLGFKRIGLALGLSALQSSTTPGSPSVICMVPARWDAMPANDPHVRNGLLRILVPRLHPEDPPFVVGEVPPVFSLEAVHALVTRTAGRVVDADTPLMEAGIDSLGAVELRNSLQRATTVAGSLSTTLVFDYPTVRQLSLHLADGCTALGTDRPASGGDEVASTAAPALEGLSAALPQGVSTLGASQQMRSCGSDLIQHIPSARWDVEGSSEELSRHSAEAASRARHGGFLHNSQLFALQFFGISASEASAMDPQQRLLLEHGYAAFFVASRRKIDLLGSDAAVNVGQWESEFALIQSSSPAGSTVYASTGAKTAVMCGRVSFALGLQGPCASFNTACSSSLVAHHSSVRAIQRLECDTALSAGVNMHLTPAAMRVNAISGFTSILGRSHTFDARADGYARGEAIVAVICTRHGGGTAGRVTGLALGSAVRQDGRSASLTAPNGQAQQTLLAAAFADAGEEAARAKSLEAHGTGTSLGDPVEMHAAAALFLADARNAGGALCAGSCKANLGHTEPSAGVVGVVALLLQLCLSAGAPNAQLRTLNPHVKTALPEQACCCLPVQYHHLQTSVGVGGALGSVSSFGFAGTIAHTVLGATHTCPQDGRSTACLPVYTRRAFPWAAPGHVALLQRRMPSSAGRVVFRVSADAALLDLVADHVVQVSKYPAMQRHLWSAVTPPRSPAIS